MVWVVLSPQNTNENSGTLDDPQLRRVELLKKVASLFCLLPTPDRLHVLTHRIAVKIPNRLSVLLRGSSKRERHTSA